MSIRNKPICSQCGWLQIGDNYFCPMCGTQQPLPSTIEELAQKQRSQYEEWHDNDPKDYHRKAKGNFCTKCGKKL